MWLGVQEWLSKLSVFLSEIRPSALKCPFLKTHCVCAPFWKGFSILILNSDTAMSAEPLLPGLETFETNSGTDRDYLFLRRWVWHNSLFFFFFRDLAFYEKEFKIIKLSKAPCFQPFFHRSRYETSSFATPTVMLVLLRQGFILRTVSK